MRTSFEKAGFSPKHIHTSRDGEEYEIDVVLPWGDKLFLFECKTDGLSDNDPVAAYKFEKARVQHITQILRQVDGLKRHPSVLQEVGIDNPENLTLVPVLLYLFPYSMPIDGRGVCVADWTGLEGFLRPGAFIFLLCSLTKSTTMSLQHFGLPIVPHQRTSTCISRARFKWE